MVEKPRSCFWVLGDVQEVAAKIESVCDVLPLSQIVQLHSDPVKAGH